MDKSFAEKVEEAKQVVESVSPQRAGELHASGAVVFVDPRPADAIASTTGKIKGALNLSLDDISAGELPAVLAERSTPIITSCQGGPMGALAAHALFELGFSDVHYVEGGTQGWLNAGLTTVR